MEQLITPTCRMCGCTDNDCSGCVARTGEACSWVENDLCSACAPPQTMAQLLERSAEAAADAGMVLAQLEEAWSSAAVVENNRHGILMVQMREILANTCAGVPTMEKDTAVRWAAVATTIALAAAELAVQAFGRAAELETEAPSPIVTAPALVLVDAQGRPVSGV